MKYSETGRKVSAIFSGFLLLMIIITLFSQMHMEIYAYSYIAGKKVEETTNRIEKIVQTRRETHTKNEAQIREVNARESMNKKQKMSATEKKQKTNKHSSVFFIKPVGGGVTTSEYGDKVSRTTSHKGHDWAVPTGTKVVASEAGVVELAYDSTSYGQNILISHQNGFQTRYAHLSQINVLAGQKVTKGETIGYSGSTGDSTGPHLHFEIIKNKKRVNPLKYLKK